MTALTPAQVTGLRCLAAHPQCWTTSRSTQPHLPFIHAGVAQALAMRGLARGHLGHSGEAWEITDTGRDTLAALDTA